MKNRIISLLTAVMLLVFLAVPVCAAQTNYVLDEYEVLAAYEVEQLNEMAADISAHYGIDVFFVMIHGDLNTFSVEDTFFYTNDYIVLIQNDDYYDVMTSGKADVLVDAAAVDVFWDAYNREETYIDGAIGFYREVEKLLANGMPETETQPGEENLEYIIRLLDDADLLTSAEEKDLLKMLDETSKELAFDIIVVTVEDFGGSNVERFTEDFYDSVYGSDRDGIILLISMAERDWCISANAEGKDIFTSANHEAVSDAIVPYLSDGEYAAAFTEFVEQCEYYVNGERNGYPFDAATSLLFALGAGLLVALIVTGVMKGQLKSVRFQRAAQNYMKPGSMQVTYANDFFLYSTVNRTRKPDNSSSSGSGGSGSHSTSSGKF